MESRQLEQNDTTKAGRAPRNLLEYIRNQSPNEGLPQLLARHHKSLQALLDSNVDIEEIRNAIFIIELNEFSLDLERIVKICAELDAEMRNQKENLEKSREALLTYDSNKLAGELRSLYVSARTYDQYFPIRRWLPAFDGRPLLPPLFLFSQPFSHDPKLSNEKNILNLLALFRIHKNFFRNYLNVLYGDEKDGEDFSGRSFEEISADYKRIRETVSRISTLLPESTPEKMSKSIHLKHKALERIMERHPATLYLATKKILLHLENSANKSLDHNPLLL